MAERFGVGFECARKIRKQQLRSGQKERVLQARRGPKPWMMAEIEQVLRTQLRAQAGVRWSKSLVWLWLQRLELRRKKNVARQ